jgi:hypothetical protein
MSEKPTNDLLDAALDRLEWEPDDNTGCAYCSVCSQERDHGHKPACPIQLAARIIRNLMDYWERRWRRLERDSKRARKSLVEQNRTILHELRAIRHASGDVD